MLSHVVYTWWCKQPQQPHERAFCFRELERLQESPGKLYSYPPGSLQARRFSGRRAHTSSPDTPRAHTCSNFVELEKIPINRHLSVYKSAFHHCNKICEIINFRRRKFPGSWSSGLLLRVYSSTINCEGSSLPGIWWRKPKREGSGATNSPSRACLPLTTLPYTRHHPHRAIAGNTRSSEVTIDKSIAVQL